MGKHTNKRLFTIKVERKKVPNIIHLEHLLHGIKTGIHRPKKGKGSYIRKNKRNEKY